ncbi:MAG: DUF1795 domain-containing protein [Gammaproteobacteria bacterium]|nr:DUF1795 domain-containing protein [Gammaproteobacteria bacterium]
MSTEHILINRAFSLKVTDGWKDATVYRFSAAEDDGVRDNIVVTVDHEPTPPGLVEYAETAIRVLGNTLQGYQELKRGRLTLNDQRSAYEVVYRWQPTEGVKQYRQVVFVVSNQAAFTIAATFTKKTWKMRGTEIGKIIKSFSVPSGGPDD